jgi:hypothetical protein
MQGQASAARVWTKNSLGGCAKVQHMSRIAIREAEWEIN